MEQAGDVFLKKKGAKKRNSQNNVFEWSAGKKFLLSKNSSFSTPTFFYIIHKKPKTPTLSRKRKHISRNSL